MRSTCFCRGLQALLGRWWVESFGQKAEFPNTAKILLNYSAMLLRSSIDIYNLVPLDPPPSGRKPGDYLAQDRHCDALNQDCCGSFSPLALRGSFITEEKPEGEIAFRGERGGSTISHDRLGYLDFRGKANVLNWEADEVLPFNLSLGSPLCR